MSDTIFTGILVGAGTGLVIALFANFFGSIIFKLWRMWHDRKFLKKYN